MKRVNTRRIKAKCTYSVPKLAEAIDLHANTIHRLIKEEGLPRIEGAYPYLLYGEEVIEFFTARQRRNKVILADDEFRCCTCRTAPRKAWAGQADLKTMGDKRGMLKAVCAICGGKMNKLIGLKNLHHLRTLLEIHTLPESALVKSTHNNANSETEEN